MKFYFYIMGNKSLTHIHIGYSKDILRTISFYNSIPLNIADGSKMNRLIYLEEYRNEVNAQKRVEQIGLFLNSQKIELIKKLNPNFIELIPGKTIEI